MMAKENFPVTTHENLPQIAEADATGEIAVIYDEMRRAMRVPTVNLIHRHMAALPGVLAWAWGLIRAPILSGGVEAALGRVQGGVALGLDARAVAFDPPTRAALARVLGAYNRGNGFNLLILGALRVALDSPGGGAPGLLGTVPTDAPELLPTLPRAGALPDPMRARLDAIARLHGMGGVIPTLYLHLALWPDALDWTLDAVEPALTAGTVRIAREALLARARGEAAHLARTLAATPPPPGADVAALRATLDSFTGRLIPEMLLIGVALDQALGTQGG